MKKNKVFNLGIGTTSILMIFIVVSLTILAILSYMVTRTDKKITDKKAEYAIKYQNADNMATDMMARVDTVLYSLAYRNKKLDDKVSKNILKRIEDVSVDYDKKIVSYNVQAGNNSSIQVELKINTTEDGKLKKKNRLDVIKWKLVSKEQEIEEQNLNLWTNE